MQIKLETETSAIIDRLKRQGYSEGHIACHRRCYDGLAEHFAATGLPFAMDEAVRWLESRKSYWSYCTYRTYRGTLFRLEQYLQSGNIDRAQCLSADDFACRDPALKLPKPLYKLYCEVVEIFAEKFSGNSFRDYSQGCKDFLLFLSEQGYSNTTQLTIDPLVEYADRIYKGKKRCYGIKAMWLGGIVNLLAYIAERGDIPQCYALVLPRNTAALQLLPLKVGIQGSAFQPSKALEPLVPAYLSSLDEMRYSSCSKQHRRLDCANFFLFLELNHIEYSEDAVKLWLEKQQRPRVRGSVWERMRRNLKLFDDYLKTGNANKNSFYRWQPLQADGLPEWSKTIIADFVGAKKQEGLAERTLVMCRAAGYRLFKYLDSNGVCEPDGITPELLKGFHNSDEHSTPLGKNNYGIKVRQLLLYMEEQGLVPPNLFLAISTQCAPCRNIVRVMSDDMVSAVYDYRAKATAPLELRNTAIVMLGLRMGLRGSDVVNLKISDFNWIKRTVTFIQQKTQKEIMLPVPVDVGNSVFKYIVNGRPESGVNGIGFVFIGHTAPFANATTQVCRKALESILSVAGLKLQPKDGFHITRRTFATRLLMSSNSSDNVSNALGHAHPQTAEAYLARDEERMRLCPLPFESVGAV